MLLSEATVAHCKSSINAISSGGGTNITKALELAFSLPSVDCVYLVTDGEDQVNIENIAASAREAGARFGIPCVPCHTTSISGASCSMLQVNLVTSTAGLSCVFRSWPTPPEAYTPTWSRRTRRRRIAKPTIRLFSQLIITSGKSYFCSTSTKVPEV